MESETDALANDDGADEAPCIITTATLHVVTSYALVALYYRRMLYRALFQSIDGKNMAAVVTPCDLSSTDPVSWVEREGKRIFVVTVTVKRLDPIGEAAAAMHALNMQSVVQSVCGKWITWRSVNTKGSAFKRSRFEPEAPEVPEAIAA